MVTIRFKSTPDNYRKEYLGLKNNTLRLEDGSQESRDVRFEICDDWIANRKTEVFIEISNTETNEYFRRSVSDITRYKDWYIISWFNCSL